MKVQEFLMTYGYMILIVITAISAIAYFGVISLSKDTTNPSAPLNTYDCGNVYVRGNEAVTGELQNASFAPKQFLEQPLNETSFIGKFLKAYYDMSNCVAVIINEQPLSPETTSLVPDVTG